MFLLRRLLLTLIPLLALSSAAPAEEYPAGVDDGTWIVSGHFDTTTNIFTWDGQGNGANWDTEGQWVEVSYYVPGEYDEVNEWQWYTIVHVEGIIIWGEDGWFLYWTYTEGVNPWYSQTHIP